MTSKPENQARAGKSAHLPELIRAMCDSAFYPHRPASVELRQTHISYVFLAGEFVYKVKKPVRFPFLDASKLSHRYRLCEDEIRLNRRLAPDLYLDVVPIVRRGAANYALGSAGQEADAEEFAVRMRRLDESRMLDRLVSTGEADEDTMRTVARRLAEFHDAVSSTLSWQYGCAAGVWRRVLGDIRSYASFVGYTVSERDLGDIEDYCRRFIESRWEMLNERAANGRVREGHGDLRAEHICVKPDRVSIYDCIEFSESIRYCDVASELGFLAMDLDRLDAARLSLELVSAYREFSGDEGMARLMPFYKCYRASIRGMVESQRSLESEVGPAERDKARDLAHRYFTMAHRYAVQAAPALVVVCGLSGSGKSTLARALSLRLGFEVINSDVVRKRLAGLTAATHARTGYDQGIYGEDFNRLTYATMMDEAEGLLRSGRGVILDATFREPAARRGASDVASRANVPWLFVECRCEEREALRRLDERARIPGEVSDADANVYRHQLVEFAPLNEIPAYRHCIIDTTRDGLAGALEAELRLAGLRSLGGSHGLEAA